MQCRSMCLPNDLGMFGLKLLVGQCVRIILITKLPDGFLRNRLDGQRIAASSTIPGQIADSKQQSFTIGGLRKFA